MILRQLSTITRAIAAAALRCASMVLVATPVSTFAQGPNPGPGPGPNPTPGGTVTNPLSNISDIPTLVTVIVDAITNIGYYIVVIFIIYAGFKFVTAAGDEGKLTDAKKMFLWTVVGTAILLGASILSTVIKNTVTDVGGLGVNIIQQEHKNV